MAAARRNQRAPHRAAARVEVIGGEVVRHRRNTRNAKEQYMQHFWPHFASTCLIFSCARN
jgi:hypothetical protein